MPLAQRCRRPFYADLGRWRVESLAVRKPGRTRGRGCAVFKCTTTIIHAAVALLVNTGSSQQPAACMSACLYSYLSTYAVSWCMHETLICFKSQLFDGSKDLQNTGILLGCLMSIVVLILCHCTFFSYWTPDKSDPYQNYIRGCIVGLARKQFTRTFCTSLP